MHILSFCNLVPTKYGAYEAFLVALGEHLRVRGDRLTLALAGAPIAPVARDLSAAGIAIRLVDGWTDAAGREHAWRYCGPARQLVRELQPDVAVVNYGNELPALWTALTSARGTRWVWQQHQQMQDPGRLARIVNRIRLLGCGFDHFVALYDAGGAALRRRGISVRRVSVVYNGIRDYRPERPVGWLRKELGLTGDEILAVCTGSLIPRKRVDACIRAVAAACGAGTPATLLIIGDGPERGRLEALSAGLKMGECVRFLGARADVREILAAADLFIHAALAEASSYAITESMAAGLPAVLTDAGAAREQVASGVSGYVVDRDDLNGFQAQVAALLNDAVLRATMGKRARERFESLFELENTIDQYVQVLDQVAGKPTLKL